MRKRFTCKGFWVVTSALWLACAGPAHLALASPPPASQQTADLEGQRISTVRIVDDSGKVLEENPASIKTRGGDAYDSLAVRESLRQLYASGRFAEIRAEALSSVEGVRLDFVVRENLFINRVRIEGLRSERLTSRALSSLQLNLGEVFTEAKVDEALPRLADTLVEDGYYESKATYTLEPKRETHQMDVTFQVTPGPRAKAGAITLINRTQFPENELLKKSKLRKGNRIAPARLDRAATRMRNLLSRKGYLGGHVSIRRGTYSTQTNELPLEIEAVAGLRVRTDAAGASVSEKVVRQLVPIYQEGTVDEDLLQEGRRNLRSYFERDGYFDVTVTYAERDDPENGFHIITYTVDRGQRRRLVDVAFQGNRYFSNDLLRARLRIRPSAFLERARFSRRLVTDDESSIRELYVANGFRNAVVHAEIVEKYQGKDEDLFVRFVISEGTQARVAGLKIEGVQSLNAEALYDVAGSTPGQPYSEFNVTGDRDNILATYFNEGFPEARFQAVAEPAAEPDRLNLVYRIEEGPQVRVNRVLLSGSVVTRTHVIDRELLIQPPEPLRQGEVVESQRQLYNLGIFSRVQIAPQNPTGTEQDKTLVVMVDEAKRYAIAYGGGIEFQRLGSKTDPTARGFRVSPRGLFEVSRNNFAGRAHTISLKARASTLQGRALLTYNAPGFFGHRQWNMLFTGLADKTADVNTFTSRRAEVGFQLEHRVSPFTSFLYRYSFRRVLVDAGSLKINPQQIPLFSQPTLISGFGMTWIRDRRDNPAEAQKGDFNTADLNYSTKALGSSASFLRLFVQNSTFHRLTRRFTFARSARFGVQEPFGGSTPIDIPLPERFFAGGGNTLRGFGLNQAGPRDNSTGFPVGGLAMLVFNNELRFPMKVPKLGDSAGGAIFYDGGNVYSRVNHINFRLKPPSPTELNYFSHTIGFGFRYGTPIGPVRFDIGYQLNPAQFTLDDGNGGVRLARLPRFQFFFNIGSIF